MVNIKIIHQDEYILALDKPPGLVVESAATVRGDSLADIAKREFGINLFRGGIVHRLDKDTSGIILLAKTQTALDNLQHQFKARKIKKEYLVLAHGFLMEKRRVEGNIGRNPGNREKFVVSQTGKEAVTEYESVERLQFTGDRLQEIFTDFNKIQYRKLSTIHYNLFTLLKCFPKTGRTHQIRVHLKYINFPVVADEKYVGRKMFRLDKRWCPRMFLHAQKIGFYHPISGRWMELESRLPEDLRKALSLLKSNS